MNAAMIAFGSEHFDAMHVISIAAGAADVSRGSAVIRTGPHWAFPALRRVCCTSEQSTQIVAAWNSLPAAEQARCHEPGFAIELFRGSESVFVAALCWRCNNISIGGALATTDWRVFDARSVAALNLLKSVPTRHCQCQLTSACNRRSETLARLKRSVGL